MKQFFNLDVTPAQTLKGETSRIKFELYHDVVEFLPPNELPVKLVVKDKYSDIVRWSSELNPGHWTEYYYFENRELIVKTQTGKLLLNHKWDADLYGCTAHNLFDMWTKMYPNSKGVVIGSNDGMTGEWVESFQSGRIGQTLMVEASEEAFKRLTNLYSHKNNIIFVNSLVSPKHGEIITFYEATSGEGVTNSMDKEHIKRYYNDIVEVEKKSYGINELLEHSEFNDLDWLHIDVEGVDDTLLMALDFTRIQKPKLIIYEHLHLKNKDGLEKWFHDNGYKIIRDTMGGFGNIAKLI